MAIFLYQLPNGESVELRLRRHSSTRKLSMRCYGNIIRLTVPKLLSNHEVYKFLKEHDQWIEEQFSKEKNLLDTGKLQLPQELTRATQFPYLGEMVPFKTEVGLISRIDFLEGCLILSSPKEVLEDPLQIGNHLFFLLEKQLINILEPLIQKWTDRLGVSFTGVQLSNAKKRWGSCTSKGKLRFNWRLIFTPLFVIESIVIHEVCHLVELNHGAAFKSLELKCNPRVSEYDQWLREHGWSILTFEIEK